MLNLTPEELRAVERALRRPIGSYTYERAAQVSGVPGRTLHHWAQHGTYVPDFGSGTPKQWSYRDLVLVRFLAWLRSKRTERETAARQVAHVREELSAGRLDPKVPVGAARGGIFPDAGGTDPTTGAMLLPGLISFVDVFDLVEPVDSDAALWGPSLVRPSQYTRINPSVHGGEPCVRHTRLRTSTLWALADGQGIDVVRIVRLYPGLNEAEAADAIALEGKLRRQVAAAA